MNLKFISILTICIAILSGCSTPNNSIKSNLKPNTDLEIATTTTNLDLEKLEAVVPILIYHHIRDANTSDSQESRTFIVSPSNFEKQLAYLQANNFRTISFGDLNDYFMGNFDLPAKPIIISFDDGAIDQYNNALPLLKKYNFSATFFVFTNSVDNNENYINSNQIEEMIAANMEFGSHGWYHLYLDKEKSDDVLNREIIASKALLEKITGQSITSFAFPFGSYLPSTIDRLKNAGYTTARGIINGQNFTEKDLFNLHGYFITNDFNRFKKIVE